MDTPMALEKENEDKWKGWKRDKGKEGMVSGLGTAVHYLMG